MSSESSRMPTGRRRRRVPGIRRRTVALIVACAATAVPAMPGAVAPAAADAVYVPWSTVLPGWTTEYVPSSDNDCVAGRPTCLRHTLKELDRVFRETATSCSHNAVFALAYLRITQNYGWSRDLPGYYADVPFANHQDAVFARYYTDAYEHWVRGDRSQVPPAWRIAFEAGDAKRVTGTGSLLLGMNAHINRDLPFVLAAVGLVAPDGSSRKPDYMKVEDFLARSTEPMMAEAAQRLDPTLDDANDALGLAYTVIFQFISAAREAAWRHAEALVSAPTPQARRLVEAQIEAYAESTARGIALAQSYLPPLFTSRARDSWCAAHKDDPAPMAYPFGVATPYGYK